MRHDASTLARAATDDRPLADRDVVDGRERDRVAGPGSSAREANPASTRRRARSRPWAWVWLAGLSALVLATSLAVAVLATPWLLPPYLVLMAYVLDLPRELRRLRPAGKPGWFALASGMGWGKRFRRDGKPAPAARGSWMRTSAPDSPLRDLETNDAPTDIGEPSTLAAEVGPVEVEVVPSDPVDASPQAETAGGKPRRGKAKGRRTRAMAEPAEPAATTATWVRIGPGKFVRVEAGATPPLDVENATEIPPTRDDSIPGPDSDASERDPREGNAEGFVEVPTIDAEPEIAATAAIDDDASVPPTWEGDAALAVVDQDVANDLDRDRASEVGLEPIDEPLAERGALVEENARGFESHPPAPERARVSDASTEWDHGIAPEALANDADEPEPRSPREPILEPWPEPPEACPASDVELVPDPIGRNVATRDDSESWSDLGDAPDGTSPATSAPSHDATDSALGDEPGSVASARASTPVVDVSTRSAWRIRIGATDRASRRAGYRGGARPRLGTDRLVGRDGHVGRSRRVTSGPRSPARPPARRFARRIARPSKADRMHPPRSPPAHWC